MSLEQFSAADLDLATRWYQSVDTPSARAVLDYLIDHPDGRFEGAMIADTLNFADHREVGRATYAYGESARLLGRARPWHESQMGYLLPADRADLLRQAREKASAS